MRLWDKIALVALVVFAVITKYGGDSLDPGDGSARRPDPGQFAPPPVPAPPAPSGPGVIVPVGDKQSSSTGTAFSVDRGGIWITARHVADGCDRIALQKTTRQFVGVSRVRHQPNTDISILWTHNGVPALPLLQHPLRQNQDGYSFGFPKGEPGDVHAKLIGQTRMRQRGRYSTDEPVVAWTHVRRVPDIGAHLGGISGGPWVNARGRILGVHVAGNPRRGRSYATAPTSLRAAMNRAGIPNGAPSGDLKQVSVSPGNFPTVGDQLRRTLTVAKVYCLVGDRWRRGRRSR